MSYFYHLVPRPFEGNELIPLNEMDQDSEIYKKNVKKYIGRENLVSQKIPILDCLWNDVVQFSALNPQLIVDELKKIQPDFKLSRLEYFKIPVKEVSSLYEGVIFDRKTKAKTYEIFPEEVQELTVQNYKELTVVPDQTKEFWHIAIENKTPVLWFPYITHVFLKGRVDTSRFEIQSINM